VIPRHLHQIWLGGPPPAPVLTWVETWRTHHPDWEHTLWTDDNRPELVNEAQFERAPTWAMKADLLRYELLLKFGGVYVDADFECHKTIDGLIGDRPLVLVSEFGVVCNSVIGCVDGHDFVRGCVERAGTAVSGATDSELARPHLLTGPYMVDRLFVDMGVAMADPGALLAGDFFFPPRTRVSETLRHAEQKRYATHHALATWRREPLYRRWAHRSQLRTRLNRMFDLSAP